MVPLRILEVGCGPGHAIALLRDRLPNAVITGIDRSALQVARARVWHAASVADGRVRLEQMALESAPSSPGAGAFDQTLAVNVNALCLDVRHLLGAGRRGPEQARRVTRSRTVGRRRVATGSPR